MRSLTLGSSFKSTDKNMKADAERMIQLKPVRFLLLGFLTLGLSLSARAWVHTVVFQTSLAGGASTTTCAHSSLWGAAGERWEPAGRLPDFSYAGYRAGEAELPTPQARWDLKRDFGARGDG